MGDLNAVEIGQQSHVKLAISAGVCLEDLLTLRGRLPRSGPYVGIVIDDFIVVVCIPSDLPEPQDLLSSRIADRIWWRPMMLLACCLTTRRGSEQSGGPSSGALLLMGWQAR